MLHKILLAFDGSKHAMKAVEYALIMAKDNNAAVEIVHVRESVPAHSSRVVYDVVEMEKELVAEAEEIVAKAVAKFKDSGVAFEVKILVGNPAEVICDEAAKIGATEIVIGSRGINTVSRFFLGSVSHKVIAHANCTTIVVR